MTIVTYHEILYILYNYVDFEQWKDEIKRKTSTCYMCRVQEESRQPMATLCITTATEVHGFFHSEGAGKRQLKTQGS